MKLSAKIDEPKEDVKQLSNKHGLDKSYDATNDISIKDNTIYVPKCLTQAQNQTHIFKTIT